MARGKRQQGVDSAIFTSIYGLASTPDYLTFVRLYLNIPNIYSINNFHNSVAGIVSQGAPIPDDWINSAITNPIEASLWRQWDLKRTTQN